MKNPNKQEAMETKTFAIEFKAVDEAAGTFEGIASVVGVEDLTGDVIEEGAFTKTISEHPEVPVLWQHDSREVIGTGELRMAGPHLMISGKFDMEDPTAVKAYRKLKSGLVRGLSIGFSAVKSTWEDLKDRSIRHLNELKLWEVSIVTFPAMPLAQVTAVKQQPALQEPPSTSDPEAAPAPVAAPTATEPEILHSGLEFIALLKSRKE
jgi:HK97 family phage prohead protease